MRFVLGLLTLCLFAPIPGQAQIRTDSLGTDQALARLQALPPYEMDEVVWLARCILSESNRPDEQRLVAWVVRNRAETQYRGDTYREVVLEPRQFSAFNTDTDRRHYLLSLNQFSRFLSWRRAVAVALDVYQAPSGARPFAISVRHFYSPISMKGGRVPPWAQQATPLAADELGIDPQRFRFYDSIDERLDPVTPSLAERQAAGGAAPATSGSPISSSRTRSSFRSARRGRTKLSGRVARPARPTTPAPRRPLGHQ